MKITLVQPAWIDVYGKYKKAARVGVLYPPLGLCYLASEAEKHGHQVEIINAQAQGKSTEEIINYLKSYKPDLIAITSTTPLFHKAKEIAEKIKKTMDTPIVVGGPHLTVLPYESMKDGVFFDYGIYGEGEKTFAELVNTLEKGGNPDKIDGLLFRRDGVIVKTKARLFEQNIDNFCFPDRKLLDPDKYLWSVPGKGIVRFTTLMTSRGCPFDCIFCSQKTIFGKKVRYRSPQNVLDEMEEVVDFFKIKHFAFLDETLTLNTAHITEICKGIIDRKLNITWEGWTRANSVNEELLKLMRKSGFVRISFGIESANQKIREIIKKGVKLEDYSKAYKIAKKLGIETRASLIIGHPYETKKTVYESFNFVKRIKECDQLYLNISIPYPGTELYEMAKEGKGGIRLLTNDFSQYKRYGDSVIEVNDLTRKDLINLQKKGFLMFYLTPRRIWYNLKRAGFKAGIRNAVAFLRSILGV